MDLSDASRDRARPSGFLPDLRHGAGADDAGGRRCSEPGICRHETALLDRPGAGAAGRRTRNGCASDRVVACRRAADQQPCADGAGDAGGAVGGLALLRARLAIAGQPQPQHVHADRDGNRRRLGLQHGRDAGAGYCSRRLPKRAWRGRGLFRGGRRHHRAGAARTGARTPRPRGRPATRSRRCQLDGAAKDAPDVAADADSRIEEIAVGDLLRVRAGREGAGGRRAARRRRRGRRGDDYRRGDAGDEAAGRPADRRDRSTRPAA